MFLAIYIFYLSRCLAYRTPLPEDLVANSFYTDSAQTHDQETENENDEVEQGDIMMNANTRSLLRNGVLGKQWANHIIPYQVNKGAVQQRYFYWVDEKMKLLFDEYKRVLGDCITFCERNTECDNLPVNKRNYIEIKFGKGGCWSSVGMNGGRQQVNLQFPSCMGTAGTPMHEIMHALGFFHEQSRPDRDSYVIIAGPNIQSGRKRNFDKMKTTKAYDHYDYDSVMHYNVYAFRNKKWGGYMEQLTRTIFPMPFSLHAIQMQLKNKGRGVMIGQRDGLSNCDELKIRRLYSEDGIEGGKKCKLWNERTCACKDYAGDGPKDREC